MGSAGKTNKPRDIAVHPNYATDPVVTALMEKGHRCELLPELAQFQLVIGPNCWRHPATLDEKDVALSIKASEFVKPEKVVGVKPKRKRRKE